MESDANITTCRLWLSECALNALKDLDIRKGELVWCLLKEAEKWLLCVEQERE